MSGATPADSEKQMEKTDNLRMGGRLLADQLRIHGVDTVFCVPGESYLGLLDGLYDHREAIRVICARHESGASNMADAYGKATGRPGICAVSRGPGATNAANGLHTAHQDSTPLIMFIGQVSRDERDREAQQEIDYRDMFRPMTKWVAEIDDADRIPEYISHAFHLAQSGRPGPVVLSLPEDMLLDRSAAADARPAKIIQAAPAPAAIAEIRERLEKAERPLVIVGGPTWNQAAVDNMTRFVEANDLPVIASYRVQDRFDNRNEQYAGHAARGPHAEMRKLIETADLIIAAGPRLGEVTTAGYSTIKVPTPTQTLVHAHPDADEIGSVYQPDLAIPSGMGAFAEALAELEPVDSGRWSEWRRAARKGYLDFIQPTDMPGDVNLAEIVVHLSQTLPEDAIMINCAGNNSGWVHRFFQYRGYGSQIVATSGSMGYGVPAAVAAKLVYPERTVVSFNGDGCFMMLGQEIATARQYGAAPIFIVVNNTMLATIRMHQEQHFPGRMVATDLVNPDFSALARAYGAHAETVRRTEEFSAAFERCQAAGRISLIEVFTDRNALTPNTTLGGNA
jgi:acetolactate synthase I/II/III large subunit